MMARRPSCGAGGGGGGGVSNQISIGGVEFLLKTKDVTLEDGDGTDAAVDGVFHAGLSLVGKRVYSVLPLVGLDLVEDLAHIARSEYLVDVGEFGRLLGWEVGREYAFC